jgi:hypothetical protein
MIAARAYSSLEEAPVFLVIRPNHLDMAFPALPSYTENSQIHTAKETRARCWTLSDGQSEVEELRDGEFFDKLADIASITLDTLM